MAEPSKPRQDEFVVKMVNGKIGVSSFLAEMEAASRRNRTGKMNGHRFVDLLEK
jgi:hypothetical protein